MNRAGTRRILSPLAAGLLAAACSAFSCSRASRVEGVRFRQVTFRDGYLLGGRFSENEEQIFYSASWEGSPVATFAAYPEKLLELSAAFRGSEEIAPRLPERFARLSEFRPEEELRGFGQTGFVEAGDILRPSGAMAEEWSDETRDGGKRVVVRTFGGEDRLEFPPGRALYETGGWFSHPRISPDGRTVAFVSHPGHTDSRGSVMIVGPEGVTKALTAPCSTIGGLAWSPSGKEIWFTAACETRGQALHAVTLQGRRRLLASVAGSLRLFDVSPGGRVLLARDSVRFGLSVLGPGPSDEVDLPWQPSARNLQISGDGALVAFDIPNPAAGSSVCVSRRSRGWKPLRVAQGALLDLSPDGRSLLIKGERINPVGLFRVEIEGGERIDLSTDGFQYISGGFLAAADRIHFLGSDRGTPLRIYSQGAGGRPEAISPEGVLDRGCPSPDGRMVIGRGADHRSYLYSSTGGAPRAIPPLEGFAAPLQWTSDAESVYLSHPSEVPARIWRIDLRSGREVPDRVVQPSRRTGLVVVKNIRLTPDARSVAMTFEQTTSDLFIADGIR